MSLFKRFWKGLVESEQAGADKYHAMGDKFHEMAEDEEDHAEAIEEMGMDKAQDKNNPWAICTAQVGRDSPKYEQCVLDVKDKMGIHKDMKEDEYDKMGIEGAGEIPKSKLSEQDLEGETKKSYSVEGTSSDGSTRKIGPIFTEEEAKMELKNQIASAKKEKGRTWKFSIVNNKSGDVITSTQDKLEDLGDKAEEAKHPDEVNGVINQIKAVQEKRQKAALKMRDANETTSKAFQDFWKAHKPGTLLRAKDAKIGDKIEHMGGSSKVTGVLEYDDKSGRYFIYLDGQEVEVKPNDYIDG